MKWTVVVVEMVGDARSQGEESGGGRWPEVGFLVVSCRQNSKENKRK